VIKILLAEDQAMVCGALAALLNMEEGLEVVAQVENGKQALAALSEHDIDILVSDIEMPEMTGIELAEIVANKYPEIAEISKLLFLSEGTVRNYLSEAISRLHATNRVDAARIARQKGWL